MPAHNNEKTLIIYPSFTQYGPTQHHQQIYPTHHQQYVNQQHVVHQTTNPPTTSIRPSNPFQVSWFDFAFIL